jgi:hypothetical protein|tara:strand:+ start:785 stop:958 length:174 start_codon:yes stop_codon:yes gene_type:complete
MKTKRIHYVTNAVGTEHRTFDTVEQAKEYALSKRTLLSVAKDKYKVMAALVKKIYNA